MPGRSHLQGVPACAQAEDFSDAERALLAELGMHVGAPRLSLVPKVDAPFPAPTPAADLRAARRRDLLGDLVMWAVLLSSVACAVAGVVSHLLEVTQ